MGLPFLKLMNTVKIYRLDNLSHTMFARLKAAQMEAAQVWNLCMELHKEARQEHGKWPGRNELQKASSSAIRTACAIKIMVATTINAWPCGNMAKTSTTSPTKRNKPIS